MSQRGPDRAGAALPFSSGRVEVQQGNGPFELGLVTPDLMRQHMLRSAPQESRQVPDRGGYIYT